MKILDFYNHQGHQYEFFKLDAEFYLIDRGLSRPFWNEKHRPLNKNVKLCSLSEICDIDFDVVIYRSSADPQLINLMRKRGARIVYVAQTVFMPDIQVEPDAIVWNCKDVERSFSKNFQCKSFDIVHGYDPEEFLKLDISKNSRILTVANSFKQRGDLLGYDMWRKARNLTKVCDVFGHGNENIGCRRFDNFKDQIVAYNTYSAYFNPTEKSAMPRSRAEAMMCGMPIITTKNYGIQRYVNEDECIFVKNIDDVVVAINKILSNDSFRERMSSRSRECAIREFSLDKFLAGWKEVFGYLL